MGKKPVRGAQSSRSADIPKDLITRQEAAKLLGYSSPLLVDRLTRLGRLQKYSLAIGTGRGGSRVRVSRADVDALRRAVTRQ